MSDILETIRLLFLHTIRSGFQCVRLFFFYPAAFSRPSVIEKFLGLSPQQFAHSVSRNFIHKDHGASQMLVMIVHVVLDECHQLRPCDL